MLSNDYDTLSQATNALNQEGYKESFEAVEDKIITHNSDKEYLPEALKIVKTYRFEGMTDPQDDAIVFAIEAQDGTKGILIMSYSAKHNQDVQVINKIPKD